MNNTLETAIAISKRAQRLWRDAIVLIKMIESVDAGVASALALGGVDIATLQKLQYWLGRFQPVLEEMMDDEIVMSVLQPQQDYDTIDEEPQSAA